MTFNLHRILYLWAGVLVLALLLIIPLAMWARVLGVLIAVCCVDVGLGIAAPARERQRGSVRLAEGMVLPAAGFRQPGGAGAAVMARMGCSAGLPPGSWPCG